MNAKRNKFKTDFINTSSEEAKKITESIVKEKIDTDKDIWIYQDTKFEQSVRCKNIISIGEYWDINARDINAGDIYAWDINAWDINAGDINAWDILCESRKYKLKESKTICRIYIKDRSKIKKKERENGGGKWKK
jgi:hypothetical protein